jgi:hypothetical protein
MGKLNDCRKNKMETSLKEILLKGKEMFQEPNNYLYEKIKNT